MLKIKNITAKNFMSIGAQTQAITLDDSQLTLVLGQNLDLGGDGNRNGTGKTTIINALSYALYGVALTNIKKDNLINLTNKKGMLVTAEFEKGNNSYRIERGRRPGILRFLINGVEHTDDDAQGDSRETQKEIENIIGFSHDMFKHIVALNTYSEPFLSMKAYDQRTMIEQLLGVTDLSEKAEVLKELIRTTKELIREEEITISTMQKSNERIQQNITEIEKKSKAWEAAHKNSVMSLRQRISDLDHMDPIVEIEVHRRNATKQEISDSLDVLDTELTQLLKSLSRSNTKLRDLGDDLVAAENGVCPTCTQPTSHLSTHEEYIADLKERIAAEQEYNTELTTRVDAINEAISVLGEKEPQEPTFYSNVEDALHHKHNLDTLIEQLAVKEAEENPYVEQIRALKDTGLQEINFETINELTYLKEHQDFLHKLLTNKDSFIRKKIIDQNISYLNHRLTFYLEKIGMPHEVKFNNDLSVEITEFGRDLDFHNLSRGEMTRVIVALSLSFRDIYESLNHPMNLLCIDELIDNGLDATGTENVLGILKKMVRDQNKNIFLISHKEELVGRVNNVLTVTKESGFTSWNTDMEFQNV